MPAGDIDDGCCIHGIDRCEACINERIDLRTKLTAAEIDRDKWKKQAGANATVLAGTILALDDMRTERDSFKKDIALLKCKYCDKCQKCGGQNHPHGQQRLCICR